MVGSIRLVDYLAVVGSPYDPREFLTEQEDGRKELMLSSEKLRKPVLLDRYPKEDFVGAPLSTEIPLFCFPDGEVRYLIDECTLPTFYCFVLTGSDGNKTYGACLNIWEEYHLEDNVILVRKEKETMPENRRSSSVVSIEFDPLAADRSASTIYMSKSICLISHYNFYHVFKFFLTQMYRISITPSKLPIERYICNFLAEVPLPPLGKVQVHYGIGDKEIYITRPPPNDLPVAELDFELLFNTLSIDNILILFDLVLQERQVLFISKHPALLAQIAEIVTSLMFPFKWHHIYIPILPAKCIEFIYAPVPFIMGTQKEFITGIDIPIEVFQIDIDDNQIVCNRQQSIPNLPERQKSKLRTSLMECVKTRVGSKRSVEKVHYFDLAYAMSPVPDDIDPITGEVFVFPTKEVRSSFFRFFVSLFLKYRQFLKVDNVDKDNIQSLDHYFNKQQFIQYHSEQSHAFLKIFLETQSFERFLLDRIEKINDNEVQFFEESIYEKQNRSKLRFKKLATPFLSKSFAISKTLMSLSPDTSNIPEGPFIYEHFPVTFDHSLFTKRENMQLLVGQSEVQNNNDVNLSWKTCLTNLNSMLNHMASTHKPESGMKLANTNLLYDELKNESLFSRFSFKMSSTCHHCEHTCSENEIRAGWSSNSSQTYTTNCPMCKKPFVPRFQVYFSVDSSSDNDKEIASCEYLSPLVIRKEIDNLISHDVKADASLVEQHAVLFWNLLIHFRTSSLPLTFILPCIDWGEVQNFLLSKR